MTTVAIVAAPVVPGVRTIIPLLVTVAIATIVGRSRRLRDVVALIPVGVNEKDAFTTSPVRVAVPGVAGGYLQIHRRPAWRNAFDEDRLRIDKSRRRLAADVNTAMEAGLANSPRDAKVGRKRWCGDGQ